MQGIKLITFDATNTLLKFKIPPWQYYAKVAEEYGFKGSGDHLKHKMLDNYRVMWKKYPNFGRDSITWPAWWRQVVTRTMQDSLPRDTDLNKFADHLINDFKTEKCWCCAEGGDKVMHLLKSKTVNIGVISNFDPRLHDILKNVNLHSNFSFILTSYETGYSKPDRMIFEQAVKRCGNVQPKECLHIGDDIDKDYNGARAAGWNSLLVNKKYETESPPDHSHVFCSLKQLASAIEEEKICLPLTG